MVDSFQKAVSDQRGGITEDNLPFLEYTVEKEFTRTDISENHRVVTLARQAAANLNRTMVCKSTGGGADANIFSQNGIDLGVLGTGMADMHTVKESVKLDDMVATAELLLEIIRVHSQGEAA